MSCNNTARDAAIIKTPYHIEKGTYVDIGVGYVSVRGKVTVQNRMALGEEIQGIDFFADESSKNDSLESSLFYDVYKKKNVYGSFIIGVMDNGKIKTTAEMDINTEEKILSAIRSGELITLSFLIPFGEYDFGLPAHFSEACKITIID